jgi:SAM-dependent methyltransferase
VNERLPGEHGLPKSVVLLRTFAVIACLIAGASFPLHAQQRQSRPNLDVPFVPTNQPTVEAMLRIANVGPNDFVIDLGSGDGRILIAAAKLRGARGFGVDLDPERVRESTENAKAAGVSDRVQFFQRNLFDTKISEATVVTMYLLPRVNLELRPRLFSELKPGTRVVSHDFSMDDWKPDAFAEMEVKEKYGNAGGDSSIYFWIVPARVAGSWQWQLTVGGKPLAYAVTLEQKYQMISGSVRVGASSVTLQDARLRGDQISFSFSAEVNGAPLEHRFSGRVTGNTIEGTANIAGSRSQGQLEWNATRSAKAGQSAGAPLVASAR